jgi:Family of unknown function (DUF5330)
MLFLIRTAFWLLVIIVLLPTDGKQQSQVYGTAQAAVQDVAGFCDRNPETCATGKDAFDVLVTKAQFGASMLMDFVKQQTGAVADTQGAVPADNTSSEEPASEELPYLAAEPATWNESQDTLNPEDREVAWGDSTDAGLQ